MTLLHSVCVLGFSLSLFLVFRLIAEMVSEISPFIVFVKPSSYSWLFFVGYGRNQSYLGILIVDQQPVPIPSQFLQLVLSYRN
ncbi:hypothetical protein OnM2_c2239o100 [Erysiphe neolycopersici]|uniref:Uncharacterized protein n=1 Tax=Erysiphe neolycopersici TaxID=212602 RepID=A0A420I0T1_9PEZI|nr:hypothetical protein OnM2_c2239o100 [Erysiphe neolycopersici]